MNRIKTIAKWTAIVVLVLLLLAAVVPFLIPVSPLTNLQVVQAAASPQSKFVTIPFAGTDGLDIHYLTDEAQGGDESTFVLLHGSNFNAFTWTEVFDFFDAQGRVIAYDQIPYGLSEKLVDGDWSGPNPYSTEAAVEQMMTLLDTLGVDRAILVGNSYGSV
ncbi:MAG: alpha/beta hydrolase, partial [Caldilineaceae bacterium]|nr:alpha/beta hydrolase [Caldilineaceae bacterium]